MVARNTGPRPGDGSTAAYGPVLAALVGAGVGMSSPIDQAIRVTVLVVVIIVIVMSRPWWRPGRGDICQPVA